MLLTRQLALPDSPCSPKAAPTDDDALHIIVSDKAAKVGIQFITNTTPPRHAALCAGPPNAPTLSLSICHPTKQLLVRSAG